MIEFIIMVFVILLMMAMMAVGVIFKRKPISGSCGGLANVGIDKACDCDEPCDKKMAELAAQGKLKNQSSAEEKTIHFSSLETKR